MKPFSHRYITDFFMIEDALRTGAFVFDKHFHSECEIYYLLEGNGKYFIENDSFPVQKGSLVIIDSLQVHHTDFKGKKPHRRILLELNVGALEPIISQLYGISPKEFFRNRAGVYYIDKENQAYMESIFRMLMDEARHKHSNYDAMIYLKMTELLIHMSRTENKALQFTATHNIQPETSALVKESIHYMMENLAAPLSLESIAERQHVSKNYLSRVFKEVTGLTVHEYLNVQRVKTAQHLLETTNRTLDEIAQSVGYNSVGYFERVFKKYTETTPVKYKKRLASLHEKARPMK